MKITDATLLISQDIRAALHMGIDFTDQAKCHAEDGETEKAFECLEKAMPLLEKVEDALKAPPEFSGGNFLDNEILEYGKWRAREQESPEFIKRIYIESDDNTHDARLYIDGNFESSRQGLLYAEEIAERLNAWKR